MKTESQEVRVFDSGLEADTSENITKDSKDWKNFINYYNVG